MRGIVYSLLGVASTMVVAGAVLSPSNAAFTSQATSQNNTVAAVGDEQAPTPSASPTPIASPTPSPTPFVVQPGDVVINEINWAGNNSDSEDEWLELRNMTSQTISLQNWSIEGLGSGSSTKTITTLSLTIPPYGYFLISEQEKSKSAMNIDSDAIVPVISISNTSEVLTLKTNTNTTIDTVAAVGGSWFAGENSTIKKSMERISPPGDGTVGTNWMTATTHTNMDGNSGTNEFGTPKAPNGL